MGHEEYPDKRVVSFKDAYVDLSFQIHLQKTSLKKRKRIMWLWELKKEKTPLLYRIDIFL